MRCGGIGRELWPNLTNEAEPKFRANEGEKQRDEARECDYQVMLNDSRIMSSHGSMQPICARCARGERFRRRGIIASAELSLGQVHSARPQSVESGRAKQDRQMLAQPEIDPFACRR